MHEAPDVVVIGDGLIGYAIAHALATRGASVSLVGDPGGAGMASRAAAGMLAPVPEPDQSPAMTALAAASYELYPAFVAAVSAAAGADVGYVEAGRLHAALDAREETGLADLALRAEPFGAERLDPVAARRVAPLLSPDVRGAVRIAREARVDNRLLTDAAARAAVAAGVVVHQGPAVELCHNGRFAAVRLENGVMIDAGAAVLAAGAWSGRLTGLPGPLPVGPARGQMLAVAGPAEPTAWSGGPTITSDRVYIVPRGRRILIGATVEDVGFAPGPTPVGLTSLVEAATALAPALAHMPIQEVWAGFRPRTPDGLPVLGADPDVPGLFYATGHFRNGILLAPITAAIMADLLAGARPAVDIAPFDPARFHAGDAVAGRADYDPDFDPDAPIRCERCGGVMRYTSSCKIVCDNCGMVRDCEDP